MELRQLRHLLMVAEELHFGRAADRLGMTQPPLSLSIQRLEAELGVQLFARTHRSVALTAVGAELLPTIREIVAQIDGLPGLAQRLQRGEAGSLTLAFVSTADFGMLPDLLRAYRAEHPEVRVTLREATSDVQIDALLNEAIDAGIIITSPDLPMHAALAYLPLRRERLIVALPERWVASGDVVVGGEGVALASLAEAPLVVFPRQVSPPLHEAILGCFADRGLTPTFGQEAVQMQTIVSLVSAELGFALVPASLRELRRAGVVYAELAGGSPEIETGLAWLRARELPTLRGLIAVVRAMLPHEISRATGEVRLHRTMTR